MPILLLIVSHPPQIPDIPPDIGSVKSFATWHLLWFRDEVIGTFIAGQFHHRLSLRIQH
jgi:hypothetical protein